MEAQKFVRNFISKSKAGLIGARSDLVFPDRVVGSSDKYRMRSTAMRRDMCRINRSCLLLMHGRK